MQQTEKVQYWFGMTMMGLVTQEKAEEIKSSARESGMRVYDSGHFFTVEKV